MEYVTYSYNISLNNTGYTVLLPNKDVYITQSLSGVGWGGGVGGLSSRYNNLGFGLTMNLAQRHHLLILVFQKNLKISMYCP